MCAIFGLAFMRGHKLKNRAVASDGIKKLFRESMNRGRSASGIAYVSASEISVLKKNIAADSFIHLPEYASTERHSLVLSDFEHRTQSIIGHCRFPTKGSEKNNTNNHPIVCSKVVGVHNGVISNDDALFSIYKDRIKRNGEVDSEIIFALIEDNSILLDIHQAITKTTASLIGSYACAMVHNTQPYIAWLFRATNPCDVVLFKDVGVIAWASTLHAITNSLPTQDWGEMERIEFPSHSGIALDTHRNSIHKFPL